MTNITKFCKKNNDVWQTATFHPASTNSSLLILYMTNIIGQPTTLMPASTSSSVRPFSTLVLNLLQSTSTSTLTISMRIWTLRWSCQYQPCARRSRAPASARSGSSPSCPRAPSCRWRWRTCWRRWSPTWTQGAWSEAAVDDGLLLLWPAPNSLVSNCEKGDRTMYNSARILLKLGCHDNWGRGHENCYE